MLTARIYRFISTSAICHISPNATWESGFAFTAMNSNDLGDMGFCSWLPFGLPTKKSLLSKVPRSMGVYAFRHAEPFSRVRGSSDILYIGSATNRNGLRGRIGQYFSPGPTQRTNQRILALITQEKGAYSVSWVETHEIARAKAFEQDLLGKYLQEHGELPPQNLRR